MIIRLLVEQSMGSVLAVDADPNSCLGLTMGVEVTDTIAGIREQARAKTPDNTGIDKTRLLEYGIQQAICEAKGFDLLTMGHPEGPSCYCAANNLLRSFMDKLSDAYSFVVLDNEAGMEHLSRRTTNNIDLLFIVAEPGAIGQITVKRIFELTRQLPITVKRTGIIWNRADNVHEMDGIESFGFVPYDKVILDCSTQSKTIFDIESSSAFLAMREIVERELKIK